eukprot:TRINITY_DN71430_c0_g1_i1.p1 TRINITY_DN71430_c0_g1~~TRINITY_DN71430_c0_g1_i1.p1  ORF type:complete len:214 (+),score=43.78 TRINITY_DN71430_c0_g1_i1:88-729(+)
MMSNAPSGWGSPAIPFLGVGRVEDTVILASFSGAQSEEQKELHRDVFRKLLKAASVKLGKTHRTRLQWNEGSVCILMDQQGALLYCAVTDQLAYPERMAYQLLFDLVVAVQQLKCTDRPEEDGLNEALLPRMKALVSHYEDPANFPQLRTAMERISIGGSHAPMEGHMAGGHFVSEAARLSARRGMTMRNKAIVFVIVLLLIVIALLIFAWTR